MWASMACKSARAFIGLRINRRSMGGFCKKMLPDPQYLTICIAAGLFIFLSFFDGKNRPVGKSLRL